MEAENRAFGHRGLQPHHLLHCFTVDCICRDALFLGTCDEGVSQLAGLLGWGAELEALVAQRAARNAAPSGTVP